MLAKIYHFFRPKKHLNTTIKASQAHSILQAMRDLGFTLVLSEKVMYRKT
jgi:hypothetical protein